MKNFIEQITVADIISFIIGLVAFVKAVDYIIKGLSDNLLNTLRKSIEPINKRLDEIESNLTKIDKEQCKSFLTQNLNSDHELSETERQRVYEVYQHYRELGGNSYIKEEFEKMQDEGKL